jgi:hypothetical protein
MANELFETYKEICLNEDKELFAKKDVEQLVDADYYERELYVIQDKIEEIWLYLRDVASYFNGEEYNKIKTIDQLLRWISKNEDWLKKTDDWETYAEHEKNKSGKFHKNKFFTSVNKVKELQKIESKLLKKYHEAIGRDMDAVRGNAYKQARENPYVSKD